MSASETLPESAPESKASYALRFGNILLEIFDNPCDAWKRHDLLLASGVDVTLDVTPAVLC
jgi:hypothetical protein